MGPFFRWPAGYRILHTKCASKRKSASINTPPTQIRKFTVILGSPSSQAPLLGPGPLRTGRETFVLIRLKPFERLLQGDAVSIRKYVGDEPCRGTLDEAERGYLHSWNHPTHEGRNNE